MVRYAPGGRITGRESYGGGLDAEHVAVLMPVLAVISHLRVFCFRAADCVVSCRVVQSRVVNDCLGLGLVVKVGLTRITKCQM